MNFNLELQHTERRKGRTIESLHLKISMSKGFGAPIEPTNIVAWFDVFCLQRDESYIQPRKLKSNKEIRFRKRVQFLDLKNF